jgi:hypothetical protein
MLSKNAKMVASPLGEDGQRRFTILESGDTEKTSTLIGKPFISLLFQMCAKRGKVYSMVHNNSPVQHSETFPFALLMEETLRENNG